MELILSFVEYARDNFEQVLSAATSFIGTFAVIARFTDNKSDDRVVQVLLDLINFLAQNGGKSKNA